MLIVEASAAADFCCCGRGCSAVSLREVALKLRLARALSKNQRSLTLFREKL
jgi:hypothetical protein